MKRLSLAVSLAVAASLMGCANNTNPRILSQVPHETATSRLPSNATGLGNVLPVPGIREGFKNSQGLPIYGKEFTYFGIVDTNRPVPIQTNVKVFNLSDESERAAKSETKPRLYLGIDRGNEEYDIFDSGIDEYAQFSRLASSLERTRCRAVTSQGHDIVLLISDLVVDEGTPKALFYLLKMDTASIDGADRVIALCSDKARISSLVSNGAHFMEHIISIQ